MLQSESEEEEEGEFLGAFNFAPPDEARPRSLSHALRPSSLSNPRSPCSSATVGAEILRRASTSKLKGYPRITLHLLKRGRAFVSAEG